MPDKRRRPNGVLLFDKPANISSHDAVYKLRIATGQRRVGHTGTLDPLAEGLLVICLGRATKIAQFLTNMDKTYEADICLGRRSRTFDAESLDITIPPREVPNLPTNKIEQLLSVYRGKVEQQVPAYSAVKVNGERLYRVARRNESTRRPIREVHIKELELLSFERPHLHLRVSCSKGTYIRALANDIGNTIGCGAYLAGLRRTRVGKFDIKDALTLEEVSRQRKRGNFEESLLKYDDVLGFSAIVVSDSFAEKVVSGRSLSRHDITKIEGSFQSKERIMLKNGSGQVLAIGYAQTGSTELDNPDGPRKELFEYIRVLN